jgi:hypothetical protein
MTLANPVSAAPFESWLQPATEILLQMTRAETRVLKGGGAGSLVVSGCLGGSVVCVYLSANLVDYAETVAPGTVPPDERTLAQVVRAAFRGSGIGEVELRHVTLQYDWEPLAVLQTMLWDADESERAALWRDLARELAACPRPWRVLIAVGARAAARR